MQVLIKNKICCKRVVEASENECNGNECKILLCTYVHILNYFLYIYIYKKPYWCNSPVDMYFIITPVAFWFHADTQASLRFHLCVFTASRLAWTFPRPVVFALRSPDHREQPGPPLQRKAQKKRKNPLSLSMPVCVSQRWVVTRGAVIKVNWRVSQVVIVYYST